MDSAMSECVWLMIVVMRLRSMCVGVRGGGQEGYFFAVII